MADSAINPSMVRFGVFELDRQARELRKSGIKIKLQDQPYEILSALLERPGEIVSREELQKRLWPGGTFVDFDLSLNSAVKKLRQALNDDSESPRFVETLYRRGYRFVSPIEIPAGAAPREIAEPVPGEISNFKHKVLWIALFLVVVAAASALFPNRRRQPVVLGYTQITHDGREKFGMLADGNRLYLTELDGDHFVLAQVSTNGGETAILPTPFRNAFASDIAPDGSAMLVFTFKGANLNDAGLWTVPLPAGAPRKIGDLQPQSAIFSPDGREILFAHETDIYRADADGTGIKKLLSVQGIPQHFRFSPGASKIRFDLNNARTGSNDLWEMNRDGSGLHPVLANWGDAEECCGVWTSDGKYYLFESLRDGGDNLWLLPGQSHWYSRKAEPIQLTNGPLEFGNPIPSSDGKKIFAIGGQPRVELLRLNTDRTLALYPQSRSVTDLAFSADGKWVAYVAVPEHTLWRSRVDGSEPLQLTSSSTYAALPRWSPDGTQITFMGRPSNGSYHAYILGSDGGAPQALVPGADGGADPGFSPDGKSVILTLGVPSDNVGSGISIVTLASRSITQLPDSKDYFSPRWSPDGKYIAAITVNSAKLMLFDVAGQHWSELADNGPIGFPSWSHDSQYLYYDTTLTDNPGLYRVHVADKKIEHLCSLKDVRRYRGEFGSWTGLAPDDSPLLTADISSQEVYALDWEAP